ncbi:hypothetical protein DSL72_000850 [Monilinia vaccinii-corymbosi]|uniref:Uncharacterized protein n=1 Tax=Monilinia vaccinii-corymbosi TaxID=61207 RepID=A0A8A3PAF7_9HELO|nr:hypothetical protein DSL72_000850 [Monilinia vaccinii-corymbosi]
MSQQVPADPFLRFMDKFRSTMAGRLQGIIPHEIILELVDKTIWHALQEDRRDYSYIVLQAVFESMGTSQEQKHRLIQYAGWANSMSSQRGNVVFPPTQPINYNDSWNARQEGYRGPARVGNFPRPCAIEQENVQKQVLGDLTHPISQLDESLFEADSPEVLSSSPSTRHSHPFELSLSTETRMWEEFKFTEDSCIEKTANFNGNG